MTSRLTPVFLNGFDAMAFCKRPNWPHMLMAETAKDAGAFICATRQMAVPIWKVEMRCAYDNPVTWLRDRKLAAQYMHIEPHLPDEAWTAHKWEIGFEAFVGGDRLLEYPDMEKLKRLKK